LGASVLYFFSINEADNDLWGHLLAGGDILARGAIPRVDPYSYTVAGQPWVNHEWLSQVVLAAVYRGGGAPALLLCKFAVATATFLAVFKSVRDRAPLPHIWGGVGLLAIAVLARGFAIRPQIFTYGGAALTLALLDHYGRGRRHVLWLFPVLFAVWANMHGGFVLGLAIFGAFASARVLVAAGRSFAPLLAWLASAAVTAVNPWGPSLLAYIWNETRRAHPITEWQAVWPSGGEHFAFLAMGALFVATLPFARRWRQDGWQAALALAVGVFALRHQRHTPVFALCAAAPLAAQLQEAAHWLAQRSAFSLGTASRRLVGAALIGLAAVQLTLTGLRVARDRLQIVFDPTEYPTEAVQALRQAEASGNLAVPLDWGAYVLWFLSPRMKVSLDGRFATVFPEHVVEDNFDFFSGAPGWRRLLERYPTQAALVPADSPCPIGTLPEWHVVFESPVARIYARTDTPAWPRFQRLAQMPPPAAAAGVFP
jgi:hypothetical protein